jgi:hypothetical protein
MAKHSTRIRLAVTNQVLPAGYSILVAPELLELDVQPEDSELKRINLLSILRKP